MKLELKIRPAKKTDKAQVLSFCRHTFSWGDYIEKIWDTWQKQKNLLVLEKNSEPVGICNAAFSPNQLWIEGIRINPEYRRQGCASRLVNAAETMARRKNLEISRMIVAKNNTKSMAMAKSNGYSLEQIWCLYNLTPKKCISKAKIATDSKNLGTLCFGAYSQSWNWFSLEQKSLVRMVRMGKVLVYSKNTKPQAMGIWHKSSNIDREVAQLGYLSGTNYGMCQILKFMQNFAYENQKQRIQILIPDFIKIKMRGLDKRMLFCLLKKSL